MIIPSYVNLKTQAAAPKSRPERTITVNFLVKGACSTPRFAGTSKKTWFWVILSGSHMTIKTNLVGQFLIATPAIGDSRFKQSVILVCAHNEEHAMGVVINDVMPELTLFELLDQFGLDEPRGEDGPVLSGGPVARDRGFVLHSDDYDCPGVTLAINEGLCLTTSRTVLESICSEDRPERVMLALGYAGWGGGQLEQELVDNAWLTAPADIDLVFDMAFSTKWSRALASIGVSPDRLQWHAGTA